VGRIGCISNNRVFVVPITYAYKDGSIYGHSQEGKKIMSMRQAPQVCFEVDTMTNLTNWKSVIIWGEYEEMKDDDEKAKTMKILNDRIMPLIASETMWPAECLPSPHPHNAGVKAVAFRIRITEKTGRYESNSWRETY
jgi:nitroimidazol reductase NimA-like FMN-containing flavoprotein (pyridoxamine 5'-phosphate oxidase superfamily)